MEEKQRVYIKGNPKRGDEVIKLLENLGGYNLYYYYGEDDAACYYINPNGEICCANTKENAAYPFLMEFYKEIKLPRWKPEFGDYYYFINLRGEILRCEWFDTVDENLGYEFGNCFRTQEEAEVARDKIKEILKK